MKTKKTKVELLKFNVTRLDTGLVVSRGVEAADAASAFGQYASCLMLAGFIKFGGHSYEWLGGDHWMVYPVKATAFKVAVNQL